MNHVAQAIAVKNFKEFIRREAIIVVVQHRRLERTANGGKKYVNDGTGPDEKVRIIPGKGTGEDQPVRVTPDGRTVMPSWFVACLPDTFIRVGDILVGETVKFEVIYRAHKPTWRRVFEAIEDGS